MQRVVVLFVLVLAVLSTLPASTSRLGGPPQLPLAAATGSAGADRAATGGTPPPVSWPTFLYNPERTGANLGERTLAPSNVSQLQEVWTLPSNGSDFSAPIVVNNTLFYGSWNGEEYAVNAATGLVEWSRDLGTDPGCGYAPMGISSTAAYDRGTLYLGGGDGYWYALNATTGQVDWRYFVGAPPTFNNYDWASALVYGSSLYIGVASCFDNPLVRGALVQVNLTGSHTANHTFYTVPANETGADIWTTPAADPGSNTIWVTTGNENSSYPTYANAIIALDASTLAVRGSWQVPNLQGQDSDFGSSPTLFQTATGTPMVVATNKNGVAYAFDRANVSTNGSWGPMWTLDTGMGFSSGAFDGHTLYLAGNGLYAVQPSNGSVLWENPNVSGVYSALTWANGIVYVGSGTTIDAVDASNGTMLWNASVPGGGNINAESVLVDGRLYVPSGNYASEGNLTAYGIPLAAFAAASPTSGLSALIVNFTSRATGGLTPYSFHWSFGDGSRASVPNILHAYGTGGIYTAQVWVNDSAGALVHRSFSIQVTNALTARIQVSFLNATGYCPGAAPSSGAVQVRLTALTEGGTPPVTDRWSFSSGGPATGPLVVRNFTGAFTAFLTATDAAGDEVNVSQPVTPPAVAGSSCTGPGFPLATLYLSAGLVGLLIAAVVTVVLLRRRSRPRPPEPAQRPPP